MSTEAQGAAVSAGAGEAGTRAGDRLSAVEARLVGLETGFEAVEARLGRLETRFEAVEACLVGLEARFETEMKHVATKVDLERHFNRLLRWGLGIMVTATGALSAIIFGLLRVAGA
jgi:hypothetical protein